MRIKQTDFRRALFFILADALIIFLSTEFAFALRFDFGVPADYQSYSYSVVIILILLRLPLFSLNGIYNISWRHFGLQDSIKIVVLLFVSMVLLLLISYGLRVFEQPLIIPRSIIPIEFFISLFLMLLLRGAKRVYLEKIKHYPNGKSTLIVADIDRASSILRTLSATQEFYPVAIITPEEHHQSIDGVFTYSYESFMDRGIECEVALIDGQSDISKEYAKLQEMEIQEIKVVKSYSDYGVDLDNISIEDFLARKPKDLDKEKIATFLAQKVVLITGAGGSIGSEIARQVASYGAKKLLLLDSSEFNLYSIMEEMDAEIAIPLLQDIKSKELISATLEQYHPEIVIHAAAYKHVPLVEENIYEAIQNNVIGTQNIIDLSIEYGVEKFIMISTDKAVRPTNVMGTTKRICELYAQNVDAKSTEIVSVRFGNVLGSSGSVIPKFKRQIQAGQNITVTHPEITRYFMLIPEACELVLQAGAIGSGGEIFILDMGEPVKIVDLAKKMIVLSGRRDIKIEFTGLRVGEKLYEELLIDESSAKTEYDSITVASPTLYDIEKLRSDIDALLQSSNQLEKLKEIVPEFDHKLNQ